MFTGIEEIIHTKFTYKPIVFHAGFTLKDGRAWNE
jgi:hypothetical protein